MDTLQAGLSVMFRLPEGYRENSNPIYFDDVALAESRIVWQPEVYRGAAALLRSSGRSTAIDIGCGCGRKLSGLPASRRIGIDFGANIEFCRRYHGSVIEWREADLDNDASASLSGLADGNSVVICADVIEHLRDPRPLLSLLAACRKRGAIIITSTPDRQRLRGADDNGPPYNTAHVREWALDEYAAMLVDYDLRPAFAGYTFNNNIDMNLTTIVSLHDIAFEQGGDAASATAILQAGDVELVLSTACDLLNQGCKIAIDPARLPRRSLDRVLQLDPTRVLFCAAVSSSNAPTHSLIGVQKRDAAMFESAQRRPDGEWVFRAVPGFIYRTGLPDVTLASGFAAAWRHGADRVQFDRLSLPDGSTWEAVSATDGDTALHCSGSRLAGDGVVDRRIFTPASGEPSGRTGRADFCYRFFYSGGNARTSGSNPAVEPAWLERKLWADSGFSALVGLGRPLGPGEGVP